MSLESAILRAVGRVLEQVLAARLDLATLSQRVLHLETRMAQDFQVEDALIQRILDREKQIGADIRSVIQTLQNSQTPVDRTQAIEALNQIAQGLEDIDADALKATPAPPPPGPSSRRG